MCWYADMLILVPRSETTASMLASGGRPGTSSLTAQAGSGSVKIASVLIRTAQQLHCTGIRQTNTPVMT